MEMQLHPSVLDITARLGLTLIATLLIGLNRESAGHGAGLRTVVLVGLSACIATSQANILLGVTGKTPDLFATFDVMRLPLGILTGIGFIGGGVILKHGRNVSGVTTAATIWAVTVIGICFGGGQLLLGSAGAALIILTLLILRWIDIRIPRDHRGELVVASGLDQPPFPDLGVLLRGSGYYAQFQGLSRSADSVETLLRFELRWTQSEIGEPPLDILKSIRPHFEVRSFEVFKESEH